MSKLIRVKAGGMFTPQEQGPCKLTIIIPEDKKAEQNYAFTMLRYQDVVVGLASDHEGAEQQTPVEQTIAQIRPFIDAIDGIMAPYGLSVIFANEEVKKTFQEEGTEERTGPLFNTKAGDETLPGKEGEHGES